MKTELLLGNNPSKAGQNFQVVPNQGDNLLKQKSTFSRRCYQNPMAYDIIFKEAGEAYNLQMKEQSTDTHPELANSLMPVL